MTLLEGFFLVIGTLITFIGWQAYRAFEALKFRNRILEQRQAEEQEHEIEKRAEKEISDKTLEELVKRSNDRYSIEGSKSGTDDHS